MKDRHGALCPSFVYSEQIECGPSRDAVVVSKRHGACELMLANLLTQQASTLHTPQSSLQCRILARKGKQPERESAAGGHGFLRAATETTPRARVSGLCHCHG